MQMATSLAQLDALIFTGGIGENDSAVRATIIDKLKILGVALDEELNAQHGKSKQGIISKDGPLVAVLATNEEWQIALEAQQLLG